MTVRAMTVPGRDRFAPVVRTGLIDRFGLSLKAGFADSVRGLRDLAELADVVALVFPAGEWGLVSRVVYHRLAGEHPAVTAIRVADQGGQDGRGDEDPWPHKWVT